MHATASLHATFPPTEARRVTRKLEFHHTPVHGSWLNMVKCELAVLSSQCLDRRLADISVFRAEVAAWEQLRNAHGATVKWHFGLAQAREKLRRPYPHSRVIFVEVH